MQTLVEEKHLRASNNCVLFFGFARSRENHATTGFKRPLELPGHVRHSTPIVWMLSRVDGFFRAPYLLLVGTQELYCAETTPAPEVLVTIIQVL